MKVNKCLPTGMKDDSPVWMILGSGRGQALKGQKSSEDHIINRFIVMGYDLFSSSVTNL